MILRQSCARRYASVCTAWFAAARAVGGAVATLLLAAGLGASPAAAERYFIVDLGTLVGKNSEANGINAAGHVVGDAETGTGRHAFLYDGTSMRDLAPFSSVTSTARGISAADQVVGDFMTSAGWFNHALLYDGTGMHDLGVLPGPLSYPSSARGINSQTQMVGYCMRSGGQTHAFLWESGQMQDLTDLVAAGSGWEITRANAINDRGQ